MNFILKKPFLGSFFMSVLNFYFWDKALFVTSIVFFDLDSFGCKHKKTETTFLSCFRFLELFILCYN